MDNYEILWELDELIIELRRIETELLKVRKQLVIEEEKDET